MHCIVREAVEQPLISPRFFSRVDLDYNPNGQYFLWARVVNPMQRRSHARKHPAKRKRMEQGRWARYLPIQRDKTDEGSFTAKSDNGDNVMKY